MANVTPKAEPITTTIEIVCGWRLTCAECENKFDSKRIDKVVCSDACRQRRARGGRSGQPWPRPERPALATRVVETLAAAK